MLIYYELYIIMTIDLKKNYFGDNKINESYLKRHQQIFKINENYLTEIRVLR